MAVAAGCVSAEPETAEIRPTGAYESAGVATLELHPSRPDLRGGIWTSWGTYVAAWGAPTQANLQRYTLSEYSPSTGWRDLGTVSGLYHPGSRIGPVVHFLELPDRSLVLFGQTDTARTLTAPWPTDVLWWAGVWRWSGGYGALATKFGPSFEPLRGTARIARGGLVQLGERADGSFSENRRAVFLDPATSTLTTTTSACDTFAPSVFLPGESPSRLCFENVSLDRLRAPRFRASLVDLASGVQSATTDWRLANPTWAPGARLANGNVWIGSADPTRVTGTEAVVDPRTLTISPVVPATPIRDVLAERILRDGRYAFWTTSVTDVTPSGRTDVVSRVVYDPATVQMTTARAFSQARRNAWGNGVPTPSPVLDVAATATLACGKAMYFYALTDAATPSAQRTWAYLFNAETAGVERIEIPMRWSANDPAAFIEPLPDGRFVVRQEIVNLGASCVARLPAHP